MRKIPAGGVDIPALGFGTWKLRGDDALRMVEAALDIGYRHIDTAYVYGNEREVGEAMRASGVPRDQVFLTTKVWIDSHRDGDLQRAAEGSLKRLGFDRVDLLLLHWPAPDIPLKETIRALNDVHRRGWTRAIGVSNFTSRLIDEAAAASEAPLATNQVEYHPYLSQRRVMEALKRHDMCLTAYSPLAHGKLVDDPVLVEIAKRHGRTASQVALRWLVQQPAVAAVPKTASPERARENFEVFDFELAAEEMAQIFALAHPKGRIITDDWAPEWDAE
jgi:diketogulonate reductase-like aldo/keto reductase